MIAPKLIAHKFLLAILYLAAFYMSVQIPVDSQKKDQNLQSVIKQQNICLVPIEIRGSTPLTGTVNIVPVVILPLSATFDSFRLRLSITLSLLSDLSSTAFFPFRAIVITTRRLRI